jgi:DNA invertase Pin-like site-specific DNA recombinase
VQGQLLQQVVQWMQAVVLAINKERSDKRRITAEHLSHRARVHVRQSARDQVHMNLESKRRWYALVERARQLGWEQVEAIDDDLGRSDSGSARPGFDRLLRMLCNGEVGAVLTIEASRLARNGRGWHALLEFCSVVGALLIDADGIYDPAQMNDRGLHLGQEAVLPGPRTDV